MSAIRGRFPVFRDKIYVNSCSQGALSDAVRGAYEEYLDGWDENGAEWEHWVERSEAARAAFAGLLGAAPDDVAIQTSVSAAVSGLISALQFRGERNRIVISENEFPTIGQIAHAQELRGAEVVQVEPDPESYAAAIDERTALVASTLVSYRTGAVHDVEAIYGLAREHGALMLVDGYQGIGAIPVEASRVGDAVVGGTVKYLLASAGLAFMALRPGLVEELVPVQTGWFADENVFDMQIERYRPHRSARRFDAGTPPVPNIYAGVAGVGRDRRGGRAGDPGARSRPRRAAARPGWTSSARRWRRSRAARSSAIRSTDAPALVDVLAADGIVASERDSNLRVSLHLYNTDDDVDAVLAALARSPPAAALAVSRRSAARRREQVRLKAVRKGEPPCREICRRTNDDWPRSPRSACSGERSSSRSASPSFFVVAVIGGLLLAATAGLQGRVIVSTLEPRVRGAGAQLRGATGAASARVGRIDWSGKREALGQPRRRLRERLAATGSRRAVAAGGAAAAAVESRGQELAAQARRTAPAQPGPQRGDAAERAGGGPALGGAATARRSS